MNGFKTLSSKVNAPVNNFMEKFLGSAPAQDNLALTILKIVIVVYAGVIGPSLPPVAKEFLDLVPVRITFIAIIAWVGTRDPVVSLLLALAFYSSMNILSGKDFFEKYGNTNQYRNR